MVNTRYIRHLEKMRRRLEAHYGPTGWWPADSPFEVAVGAVLTQNTAWVNVEKAIANLKAADQLCPIKILEASDEALHAALRPSGYFRVKAERLRHFCRYLVREHGGSMEALASVPLEALRKELLTINGIGPETADCILLYACGKPVFVIDAYTRRILRRHGVEQADAKYDDLRRWFEENLTRDVDLWKEYHAWFVYVGKDFCRTRPRCEGCPLEPLLKANQAPPR